MSNAVFQRSPIIIVVGNNESSYTDQLVAKTETFLEKDDEDDLKL